jgi:hypothetical protein
MKYKIHPKYELKVFENGEIEGKRGGILKPRLDRYGYPNISVYHEGKRHTKTVHRIVAEVFIPNPDNLYSINHKDGIKTNNEVSNLEWCTIAQNNEHSYMSGLRKLKVQPEQVPYIYTNPDNLTAKELSAKFGVKLNTIYGIIYGYKWKSITKDLTPNVVVTVIQNHNEHWEGISPYGKTVRFSNKTKFAKENGLSNGMICTKLKTTREYKGWSFKLL